MSTCTIKPPQPCIRTLTALLCTYRVGKQIVNVPSFMVRVDSQKHIDFALNSPFGGGRPGRNKRRSQKCVSCASVGLVSPFCLPKDVFGRGFCWCCGVHLDHRAASRLFATIVGPRQPGLRCWMRPFVC
jgi:hypothetical protein